MSKNNTAVRRISPLTLASLGALGGLQPAAAGILLYGRDETTFSSDGYFNAFYTNNDVDHQGETYSHRQPRVKIGFLPNYIGLNFGREIGELSFGGRVSFWVTINGSETDGTDTVINVHQPYDTVAGDWDGVLIGRDLDLFSRSNVFLDELLVSFDNPSGALGLMDGKGVLLGNIGTGYPYPLPTSQITCRSNDLLPGLRIVVGIFDPIDSNQIDKDASDGLGDRAYQGDPRYESEVNYQLNLAGTQVYNWINGGHRTSENTNDSVDSVTSKGVGYGLQVKMGGLSATGSGLTAKGINPFFTNNADGAVSREVDNRGALLQGSYSWSKNRLTLSYGKTVDDGSDLSSTADYESRGIAYFRTINDSFKPVAELDHYQVDGRDGTALDKDTGTVAFGAVLNW